MAAAVQRIAMDGERQYLTFRQTLRQLPTPLPRASISESMARWTAVICST
jgi:hypothetical protein